MKPEVGVAPLLAGAGTEDGFSSRSLPRRRVGGRQRDGVVHTSSVGTGVRRTVERTTEHTMLSRPTGRENRKGHENAACTEGTEDRPGGGAPSRRRQDAWEGRLSRERYPRRLRRQQRKSRKCAHARPRDHRKLRVRVLFALKHMAKEINRYQSRRSHYRKSSVNITTFYTARKLGQVAWMARPATSHGVLA
jgi:hypothetical protein